jgi:hypothetical protein
MREYVLFPQQIFFQTIVEKKKWQKIEFEWNENFEDLKFFCFFLIG